MAIEYGEICLRNVLGKKFTVLRPGGHPVTLELDRTSISGVTVDICFDHSGVLADLSLDQQGRITGLNQSDTEIPLALWVNDPRGGLVSIIGYTPELDDPKVAKIHKTFQAKFGTPLELIPKEGRKLPLDVIPYLFPQISETRVMVPESLRRLLTLTEANGQRLPFKELKKSPLVPTSGHPSFLF